MSDQGDPKAAEQAQAANETSQEAVVPPNAAPEAIPYDRFKQVNEEKKLAAERAERLEQELLRMQQQYAAQQQVTSQPASEEEGDSDAEWLQRNVSKVMDQKFAPIQQDLALMKAQTKYAQWEAGSGYLDPVAKAKVRDTYFQQIVSNPALEASMVIQDIADWVIGQAHRAELEDRALKASLQQQQVSQFGDSSTVAASRPSSATVPPPEPGSKEYLDQASADDVWASLRQAEAEGKFNLDR